MKLTTTLFGKTYKYETVPELIAQLKEDMRKAEEKYKKVEKEYETERKKYFVLRKAIKQLTGEKPAVSTESTKAKDDNS